MTDYSLDNVAERAQESRHAFRDYVDKSLAAYVQRAEMRKANGLPAFGICGHGRAGKDTAGTYICAMTPIVNPGSASKVVLPIIAHSLRIPGAQAYAERHQHREFWIAWCHAFRTPEYDLLVRMCLGYGDIAIGIRGELELRDVLRKGIIDCAIWIENARVPPDITVEYGPEDCDLVLINNGSRREFYNRLDRFLHVFGFDHLPSTGV